MFSSGTPSFLKEVTSFCLPTVDGSVHAATFYLNMIYHPKKKKSYKSDSFTANGSFRYAAAREGGDDL